MGKSERNRRKNGKGKEKGGKGKEKAGKRWFLAHRKICITSRGKEYHIFPQGERISFFFPKGKNPYFPTIIIQCFHSLKS